MKKITREKGFSVVEILIVVLVSAIVLALAIPSITRSRVNSNESYARETLKQIGMAFEEYSRNNNGLYPLSIANLTTGSPRYLAEDYTAGIRQGYAFSCAWSAADYQCFAIPVKNISTANTAPSGTKKFIITAGLILTEDDSVTSVVGSVGPINDTNTTNITGTVLSGSSF
ncbi:MAG: prepilin-type N-terminal cleavage/methylation domain-containing protein [Candidatus Omnitrophota bacterium]